MEDIATYTGTAIEHAAIALLWQASDASENGGDGFPIGDGGNEYADRVVAEVPYIAEAVTAFVAANYGVLALAGVTAEQCGHDFILTANGHGAGFWDRGLDMPVNDPEAYTAWQALDRAGYAAWLTEHRPYLADKPQSAGDYLTDATRGYSFDAEFALDEDGDVTWLLAENTVLVDELGWSSEPDAS